MNPLFGHKFENWQKVDEVHGLGQRTGQFYIYNFEKKEEILLENTDQAFVLPIRDKNDNVTFQAIFAHKDGQWHILEARRKFTVAARSSQHFR